MASDGHATGYRETRPDRRVDDRRDKEVRTEREKEKKRKRKKREERPDQASLFPGTTNQLTGRVAVQVRLGEQLE